MAPLLFSAAIAILTSLVASKSVYFCHVMPHFQKNLHYIDDNMPCVLNIIKKPPVGPHLPKFGEFWGKLFQSSENCFDFFPEDIFEGHFLVNFRKIFANGKEQRDKTILTYKISYRKFP